MMELRKNNTNRYRVLWALPVFALMFFVFSCQEEEDAFAQADASLENYENIQEEIRALSFELQETTKKYPEYKMHIKVVGGEPPKLNSAEDFISMVEGVDNSRDKETIGQLHYMIHTLREKLPKQAMADGNEVFTVVEDQPTPEGGMEAFYDYVKQNLVYPAQARRMGIEGRVFVQFVVEKDGTITDVKAVKGIGAGCDEAAVAIMKNAAAWNPGLQRGRAVKVRMVLPITFRLGDGEVGVENISEKPSKMNVQSTVNSGRVAGKVVDENNRGVPGVNIIIKGTTMGTVTDRNGNYQLALPADAESLIFSSTGYASEELNINGNSVINVQLEK